MRIHIVLASLLLELGAGLGPRRGINPVLHREQIAGLLHINFASIGLGNRLAILLGRVVLIDVLLLLRELNLDVVDAGFDLGVPTSKLVRAATAKVLNVASAVKATVGVCVAGGVNGRRLIAWLLLLLCTATCSRSASASATDDASMPSPSWREGAMARSKITVPAVSVPLCSTNTSPE